MYSDIKINIFVAIFVSFFISHFHAGSENDHLVD